MVWTEQKLNLLASEYARVGYVPGPDAPAFPPEDVTPDDWLICLYIVPDGVGRQAYDVALSLAVLFKGGSPERSDS